MYIHIYTNKYFQPRGFLQIISQYYPFSYVFLYKYMCIQKERYSKMFPGCHFSVFRVFFLFFFSFFFAGEQNCNRKQGAQGVSMSTLCIVEQSRPTPHTHPHIHKCTHMYIPMYARKNPAKCIHLFSFKFSSLFFPQIPLLLRVCNAR